AAIAHMSRSQQIKAVIRGFESPGLRIAPLRDFISGWMEWQKAGAFTVRFERHWSGHPDLADFLGVEREVLGRMIDASIGRRTRTLNKGIACRWKDEMDDDLIAFFKAHEGGCVEALGYSWD